MLATVPEAASITVSTTAWARAEVWIPALAEAPAWQRFWPRPWQRPCPSTASLPPRCSRSVWKRGVRGICGGVRSAFAAGGGALHFR